MTYLSLSTYKRSVQVMIKLAVIQFDKGIRDRLTLR